MNPERLRSAPGGRGCPIGAGGTGGKCCAEDETLQSKVLIWDSLNLWKKKEVHAAAVEPPRARRVLLYCVLRVFILVYPFAAYSPLLR